jgi:hypothetical protein
MTAFALALAAGFATPASAQSLVGTWTATAHLQGGAETSETLTVAKADNGYSITGKVMNPQPGAPDAGPGTDVVIDGDKFSYKRSVSLGGAPVVISYSGTVSGDSFTGIAEMFDTKIPYTGVRVAVGK